MIANPPPTNFEYLKALSQIIFEKIRMGGFGEEIVNTGIVAVQAGGLIQTGIDQYYVVPSYKASMAGQAPTG